MTLIINSVDLSSYIEQTQNITEYPIYVNGPLEGKSKTGKPFHDRIRTRYGFTRKLVPIPQSVMAQVLSACEGNSVEVTYTSARAVSDVTANGQASVSGFSYALDHNGERYYYGATITVELD